MNAAGEVCLLLLIIFLILNGCEPEEKEYVKEKVSVVKQGD